MDTDGLGGLLMLLVVGTVWLSLGAVPVLEHNGAVQENEPTTATVTDLRIEWQESDDGKRYRPVITYNYTVDGQTYQNSNVYPGSLKRWKGDKEEAQAVLDEYEVGQSVTVYYNPQQHSHAYLREGGMPGLWFMGAIFSVLMLLVGTNDIFKGFLRRKQRTLIEDTPTETARSLSMGPSEVEGVARSAAAREQAPFTTYSCVIAKWEILEYDEDSGSDGDWTHVGEGLQLSPFLVEDETGKALVRPHEDATYELDEDDWTELFVAGQSHGSDSIQAFVEDHPDIDHSANGDGKHGNRKYRQNIISPGDDVYVFGTVQPRDGEGGTDNTDNLVIEKVDDDDPRAEPMFMIAEHSAEQLVHSRRFALWRLPIGILLVVGSLGLLLGMFGHLIGVSLPVV